MADAKNKLVRNISFAAISITALGILLVGLNSTSVANIKELSFPIIDGREIGYEELQGQPVLVSFWATTCAVCIKKTPELIRLYETLHPRGLELIAVAMAYDPPNRILSYSRSNNIPYPVALDLDGHIARAFDNVSVTPTVFLIDAKGEVVFNWKGDIDIQIIEAQVVKLLQTEKKRNS